jgi:hypothetical protein
MKIAKQFSRFGIWFLHGHLQFSHEDTAGLKTCSLKEFCGWIAAWMTKKTLREQSLAKPSTIHVLIQIPVRRQSDSYFKR